MKLSAYTELIKHLPYGEQSFETSRETWSRREYKKHDRFTLFCRNMFGRDSTVTISRSDLFLAANGDLVSAIYSIILWGYPRNMRGNSFKVVLENVHRLEGKISFSGRLTVKEFKEMRTGLAGSGIGLSTLTKILYFFNITIEGSRCLILDSRIIEVLKSGRFEELHGLKGINEFNKDKYYSAYIKTMGEIANKDGYSVDQLELFLFMFGNSLKTP